MLNMHCKLQMELNNVLLCCLPLSSAQSLPRDTGIQSAQDLESWSHIRKSCNQLVLGSAHHTSYSYSRTKLPKCFLWSLSTEKFNSTFGERLEFALHNLRSKSRVHEATTSVTRVAKCNFTVVT